MTTRKPKMSLTPPTRSAEEFIKGAGELQIAPRQASPPKTYPWEQERVREDVIKSINLRLSEPYILKLQYLSEATHKSQQELIREVLLPAIDAQIHELTGQR